MASFGRKVYDRNRPAGAGDPATRRRRRKRAIATYREILAVNPNDLQVHRKIAPLLAQTREARRPSRATGAQARSSAARASPTRPSASTARPAPICRASPAVLALADLEVERGHDRRGQRADRRLAPAAPRRTLQEAVALLQRARKIQPHAFDPASSGRLLARHGGRAPEEAAQPGRPARAAPRPLRGGSTADAAAAARPARRLRRA